MEDNKRPYAHAYSRRECRSRRFGDYLVEDLSLEQMMLASNQAQPITGSQGTVDQLKWWFRREGIYKNLSREEAVYIKREIARITSNSGQAAEACNCLVIAGNELLVKNKDIDKSYARVPDPESVKNKPTRRPFIVIQVPSELRFLCEADDFRNFQRLIFNTRVHFDSSFEANLWAPDERGVHARSPELQEELKILSNMHNKFVEACKQFKSGNTRQGWAMVRSAFELSDRIVHIRHHRLFPDLLGILLLLQQRGYPEAPGLDAILREHLALLARVHLLKNDPRRQFFEFIMLAPLQSVHHLCLIFDAQCRQLWSSNVKGNEIESYYSYNQASFPRAVRGDFYSLFQGKTLHEFSDILSDGDNKFGLYSTEALCLWHTALQYFASTENHDDMAYLSDRLCVRLEKFKDRWDHNLPAQLNHDAAMGFYLHGHAEDARKNTMNAADAFFQCIKLRSQATDHGTFDPLTGIAVRRLQTIASRIGDGIGVGFYQGVLDTLYSELEARYMQDMASFQHSI
ncbi:hypothetical protein BJX99DRAFT_272445 [Aspergillus californicus]